MIPETLRPLLIVAPLLFGASTISAETFSIKVMDEQNKGVRSRVLYKTTAVPSVLGDTDNQGRTLVRNYHCAAGQVLAARPFDIGSYFESTEEPCRSEVTLRVISRQTPRGPAVQFRVESITFPDGSPGVITYKGIVTTFVANTPGTMFLEAGCSIHVDGVVEQKAFKTDNASWKEVARNEVDPTAIFSGTKGKLSKSALLPFACSASGTGTRIQVLQSNTATELSRQLDSTVISVPISLELLGVVAVSSP